MTTFSTPASNDAVRLEEISRRRRFADALRQEQQPQGQMVGGIYVAPSITQNLATLLKNYQGGQINRQANKDTQAVIQGSRDRIKNANQNLANALRGQTSPEVDGNNVDDANFMNAPGYYQPQTTQVPNAQQIQAAQLQYAQELQDPQLIQQALSSQANFAANQSQKQDDRTFRAEQAELGRQQREQEIQARIDDRRTSEKDRADLQRELAKQQIESRKELAQISRNNQQSAQPYFQALPTDQGYARFNARTGQLEPISVNGNSVLPAAQSPSLQGKITTAKEQSKLDVDQSAERQKNVKKADQFIATAQKAKALLDKNPTSSGIGTAVDAAGRVVGRASESANTASELEAVSGWLVSNVPRMEGPQSNFDVQNYQTMAGKIGDRTVPLSERKAALKTVIELQEKYKALNQDSPQDTQKIRRFNRQTGRIE